MSSSQSLVVLAQLSPSMFLAIFSRNAHGEQTNGMISQSARSKTLEGAL